MPFDGLLADEQLGGDLAVGIPAIWPTGWSSEPTVEPSVASKTPGGTATRTPAMALGAAPAGVAPAIAAAAVRKKGFWWKSVASVNDARSSSSHAAPGTAGRLRGAGSLSEHDWCISHDISLAVTGRLSNPTEPIIWSRCSTSESSASSSASTAIGCQPSSSLSTTNSRSPSRSVPTRRKPQRSRSRTEAVLPTNGSA